MAKDQGGHGSERRAMSSHELINRAHAQGKRAKDAGRKKDDNPFSVGIPEHYAWEKGRSDIEMRPGRPFGGPAKRPRDT